MKDFPLFKKIVVFGFALFLISFTSLVVLETDHDKPFDLQSEQGIITLLFITSILLMLVGYFLSKIKRK